MARKRRPEKFSVVKAVKLNARTQVGQPPASRVFAGKSASRAEAKHKATLVERMAPREDEG